MNIFTRRGPQDSGGLPGPVPSPNALSVCSLDSTLSAIMSALPTMKTRIIKADFGLLLNRVSLLCALLSLLSPQRFPVPRFRFPVIE
ncbi:MAG: hypothetical protein ABIO86_02120 [Sphingomonas sp.]